MSVQPPLDSADINTSFSNLFFTADGRHIVTANGTLSVLRIPATILAGGQVAQGVPTDAPKPAAPSNVAPDLSTTKPPIGDTAVGPSRAVHEMGQQPGRAAWSKHNAN